MFPYKELADFLGQDLSFEFASLEQQFACEALRSSFYKKLLPSGHDALCDARATEKFLECNRKAALFAVPSGVNGQIFSIFKEVFAYSIEKRQGSESIFNCIRNNLAIGPGAARGVNSESFYTKLFDGDLTATNPHLLRLYRAAILNHPTWASCEYRRSQMFGIKILPGNKLFHVPKNNDISRCACTENILNMVFQKAIGAFLESVLAEFFNISLKTQPDHNRELAYLGSIDGSFATIDLSSASDSISLALVESICPNDLLGWLHLTRSSVTVLPDGSTVPMNIISTMGNGFTFPLETMIFASAVKAVSIHHGIPCIDSKKHYGVFGDDIICRREIAENVISFLNSIGFSVNERKTFIDGPFRESCGVDVYRGYFTRGVYIYSLETVPDIYSAVNRLVRWSARHKVPLTRTIGFLLKNIGRIDRVPFHEDDCSGLKVPRSCCPKARRSVYGSFLYRKWVQKTRRIAVPENPDESKAFGFHHFIDEGWLVHNLGGYSESGLDDSNPSRGFTFVRPRHGRKSWRSVRSQTPYWDYVQTTNYIFISSVAGFFIESRPPNKWDELDFRSWKATVELLSLELSLG